MRYVSLMSVMKTYNLMAKERAALVRIPYQHTSRTFVPGISYAPFFITAETDPETGQVTKTLELDSLLAVAPIRSVFHHDTKRLCMPPVLEIEWLKEKLDLPQETADALEQLACLLIVWVCFRKFRRLSLEDLEEVITEHFIVEMDDLSRTQEYLESIQYQKAKGFDTESWYLRVCPVMEFWDMASFCKSFGFDFKHTYLSLPLLLILFMVDYGRKKRLENWPADQVLETEQELQEYLDRMDQMITRPFRKLTYFSTDAFTEGDIALIRSVLTVIVDRLHEQSKDVGIISYWAYRQIKSSQKVRANVLLSDMEICWVEEMARADRENLQEE